MADQTYDSKKDNINLYYIDLPEPLKQEMIDSYEYHTDIAINADMESIVEFYLNVIITSYKNHKKKNVDRITIRRTITYTVPSGTSKTVVLYVKITPVKDDYKISYEIKVISKKLTDKEKEI
jgi:hypothetical protein